MDRILLLLISLAPSTVALFILLADRLILDAIAKEFDGVAASAGYGADVANLIMNAASGYHAMSGVFPTLVSVLVSLLVVFGASPLAMLFGVVYCLAIFLVVRLVMKGSLNFYELSTRYYYFGSSRIPKKPVKFPWSDAPLTHTDAISALLAAQNLFSMALIVVAFFLGK